MREPPLEFHPVVIMEDRYTGAYSGGRWLMIVNGDALMEGSPDETRVQWCLLNGPSGNDGEAMNFWLTAPDWIVVGDCPRKLVQSLSKKAVA